MANEKEERQSQQPHIVVDTDWKSRVEAEKEALRQQAGRGEAEAAAPTAAEDYPPPPPASFAMLANTIATQALMALGQVPDPVSGKREAHLPMARHFIDTLAMLEEKTSGNLTADEAAMLDAMLHELRMVFLAAQSRR